MLSTRPIINALLSGSANNTLYHVYAFVKYYLRTRGVVFVDRNRCPYCGLIVSNIWYHILNNGRCARDFKADVARAVKIYSRISQYIRCDSRCRCSICWSYFSSKSDAVIHVYNAHRDVYSDLEAYTPLPHLTNTELKLLSKIREKQYPNKVRVRNPPKIPTSSFTANEKRLLHRLRRLKLVKIVRAGNIEYVKITYEGLRVLAAIESGKY